MAPIDTTGAGLPSLEALREPNRLTASGAAIQLTRTVVGPMADAERPAGGGGSNGFAHRKGTVSLLSE